MSISTAQARRTRDEVEAAFEADLGRAMRSYLADVKQATLSGLTATRAFVAAASTPEPLPSGEVPSLGSMAGRWASGVDARLVSTLERSFSRVWRAYTSQGIEVNSPAERGMRVYLAGVRDRLVRGEHFGVTVYEDSFEAVRLSLAQSVAEGWTRPKLAQRIAAELSWETDGDYWRAAKADADFQIDAILDPLGKPGTPAREHARFHDARVIALRRDRNRAIRHLDAEKSVWQARASLIARTESTGLTNYGAQTALIHEGAERKMWVSTSDARTRASHALAGGQEAAITAPFTVGGAALQYPGDPNGPVEEVANCRCALVSPDNL